MPEDSWLGRFMAATANLRSPELYRIWGGIVAISGAVERCAWIDPMKGKPLYPNVYVMLVGPPATGKSLIIGSVMEVWRGMERLNIGPDRVTTAALQDCLEAQPRSDGPNGIPVYNALVLGAPEFANLMSKYDNEFLALFNGLYDCDPMIKMRTRSRGELEIARPSLVLFGGTQPHFLAQTFPVEAWTQGFTSRTLMVYQEEGLNRESLWAEDYHTVESDQTPEELGRELRKFLKRPFGHEMVFNREAKDLINIWHVNGEIPRPISPRAAGYNQRRDVQVFKLAMIFALAEFQNTIELKHVELAFQLLEHTESQLDPMHKAIELSGQINVMGAVFGELTVMRPKKGLFEGAVIRALISSRVFPTVVQATFDTMISTGMLRAMVREGPDLYRLGVLPEDAIRNMSKATEQ